MRLSTTFIIVHASRFVCNILSNFIRRKTVEVQISTICSVILQNSRFALRSLTERGITCITLLSCPKTNTIGSFFAVSLQSYRFPTNSKLVHYSLKFWHLVKQFQEFSW